MGKIIKQLIHLNPNTIEVQYYQANSQNYALLIPPCPKLGATMHNRVISALFKTFIEAEWNVLRFNFRDAGLSKGVINPADRYTLIDTNRVLDWYIETMEIHKNHFIIAGYALGALLALETLMRRPELNNFIAISPPAQENDFSFLAPCTHSGLFVHGLFDEITPLDKVQEVFKRVQAQQEDTQLELINDNHYFSNHLPQLQQVVDKYIRKIAQTSLELDSKKHINFFSTDEEDL